MLPQTIAWTGDTVRLLDQTRLPVETVYVDIIDERQMYDAIKRLVVRGAPAIGVAAAFGAYLGVRRWQTTDVAAFMARLHEVCGYLASSRPTAVNLSWALKRIQAVAAEARQIPAESPQALTERIKGRILTECLAMLEEDARVCRAIGENTLELLRYIPADPIGILTHCNAGSLATVRYGTALAGIYLGAEQGLRFRVFADETRPLLQGSRITAYELAQANIPVTVICDNMAATVMSQKKIQAILVGADRIAANGDVANKIGTLALAILAAHFSIPFYVAAPTSTIDLSIPDGRSIPIEERHPREITRGLGSQTAPDNVAVYNPAFDVTPAPLVTALITERRIVRPPYTESLRSVVPSAAGVHP